MSKLKKKDDEGVWILMTIDGDKPLLEVKTPEEGEKKDDEQISS